MRRPEEALEERALAGAVEIPEGELEGEAAEHRRVERGEVVRGRDEDAAEALHPREDLVDLRDLPRPHRALPGAQDRVDFVEEEHRAVARGAREGRADAMLRLAEEAAEQVAGAERAHLAPEPFAEVADELRLATSGRPGEEQVEARRVHARGRVAPVPRLEPLQDLEVVERLAVAGDGAGDGPRGRFLLLLGHGDLFRARATASAPPAGADGAPGAPPARFAGAARRREEERRRIAARFSQTRLMPPALTG